MNFGDNETNRWDSSPHFQQPSYRLIDRLIRLRTTYWNRQYAIILLAYTGLTIVSYQFTFHYKFFEFLSDQNKLQIKSSHYDYISYYDYGYLIGFIPAGVLATIYPAHNILGISVAISSILYLIIAMIICYIDTHTHFFLQFCMGITMAGVFGAIDRVWTYWVPLNTQSIRHVPIILYDMAHKGGYMYDNISFHHTYSSYTLTLYFGVIGLAWYVLWLYVINDNQFQSLKRDIILFGGSNDPRYPSRKPEVSLTRSIVSDIPWKSLFTSMPVLVIALLYVFDGQLYIKKADGDLEIQEMFERQTRAFTIVILILIVIMVELAPEIIIVSISTTNIRKFWNCLYFGLMSICFILESFTANTLKTYRIYHFIVIEIEYLSYFGYFLNYLDIAPNYASLIFSFLMVIRYISNILCENVNFGILNDAETNIFMAVICLTMATFYDILGSAEIQPWAEDKPVEENQQNLVENENLPSV